MSELILPNVRSDLLIDTLSKNENSRSAIRIKCSCGNFLGVMAGFKPLENGRIIIHCEELKMLKVADTVEYFRRLGRDPNLAGRKGCGRIVVISPLGQVEREFVPGNEDHSRLKDSLDAIKKKKEHEEQLKEWAAKHARDFQTPSRAGMGGGLR